MTTTTSTDEPTTQDDFDFDATQTVVDAAITESMIGKPKPSVPVSAKVLYNKIRNKTIDPTWDDLSDEGKATWDKNFIEEKNNYKIKMDQWKTDNPEIVEMEKKKQKECKAKTKAKAKAEKNKAKTDKATTQKQNRYHFVIKSLEGVTAHLQDDGVGSLPAPKRNRHCLAIKTLEGVIAQLQDEDGVSSSSS